MTAKILIIEDDATVRKLLDEFLSICGYRADCAGNGTEALGLIENGFYDLLVTDYKMPGLNGVDLVKKVRENRMTIPIIAMSGDLVAALFLDAGADRFMKKPLDLERLKKAIEALL